MNPIDFGTAFEALTGNAPFPWQTALYGRFTRAEFPDTANLPTGLGKTSVIAIWLIALANDTTRQFPRRLVYVVNRRTVVDQTTDEVENYQNRLDQAGLLDPLRRLSAIELKQDDSPLALSTLRGQFADNRAWSADPSRPAVICGTVDMIGSRLLFSGYGIGFKGKPLHAGFLGQDVLLVHDEAHLEPAFQKLIEAIRDEQHNNERTGELPWPKLRVMALTATPRGAGDVFELTTEEKNPPKEIPDPPEEPIHHVWRRLKANKGIRFVPARRDEVAAKIGRLARDRKATGKAILVFVRTIDDVKTVQQLLTDKKEGVPADQVEVLTGTLRGLERDRLVETTSFRRLLLKAPSDGRTVYLVCTSAGEVGVDISADHMICDLTALDSMAQRLGRVNRRGGGAAEIDVVYESDPDPKPKSPEYEKARWKTLEVLRRLPPCDWTEDRQEGSPLALRNLTLSDEERKAAFAPEPTILPTSDILFDSWALTTIRGKLPGRPMVEPYLHGVSDYDPPQTTVAWRDEVERLTPEVLERNRLKRDDLLDLYPLKPHEELSGETRGKNKVFEQLEAIATRDAKREPDKRLSAWVIEPDGSVTPRSLQELVEKDNLKKPKFALGGCTVILPPHAGGLRGGLLVGDEPYTETTAYDVSGDWYVDRDQKIPRRVRVWDHDDEFDEKTGDMRRVRRIDFPASEDDDDSDGRSWYWFVRPDSADDDASKTTAARRPITWKHHTDDVVCNATRIADALLADHPDLHAALVVAAQFHDLGKRRVVWQKSIGNPNPKDWYAKSGGTWKTREITDFRHEFGSLLDILDEAGFRELKDEWKELVLHLIAVHHGRGRPHFPADEAFDPEPKGKDAGAIAAEIPRRFARLQRKYGRWGLAYLESLLRAADWAASARPSPFGEEPK